MVDSNLATTVKEKGLEIALESGKYHDLVVRCESREWKVHRVILCAKSTYFSKACEDTFKEGISGEINLQEDDPDMVDNMLRFLYTLDYQDGAEGGRPLLVNAKMYAIGDKYCIEALKKLAKTKFSEALDAGWDIVSFPEVIETVYTTTPATDRDLRDCLTHVLLEHKEELHEHEGFVGLVKDKLSNGEFAMDVIYAWTEFRSSKKDSSNTYTQGPFKYHHTTTTMASHDSQLDQSKSLTYAFESGNYSDLIVKCHEQTWRVHRVILCTRSRYFESCCKHNFKEGVSGVIELQEDDPIIVGKMLCYFYTCDYSDSGDNSGDAIINVLVYAIADKYNVPLLQALAKREVPKCHKI